MVDPIEVKLDEIDAKIDQIAYAPKYKPTYEIEEMMKKGGGAGGGLAGAGMVAGATGAVVLELLNVLKDTLKQSKIISTIEDQVGKALGLLLDLVLLPFLPLLALGIRDLYLAVIDLGKVWNEWVKKNSLPASLGDPNKSALTKTIDFVSWVNDLAKAWFNMMTGLIAGTALAVGEIGADILKFLWDIGTEIGTIMFDAVTKAGATFGAWISKLVSDFETNIGAAWNKLTKLITDWFNSVLSLKWLTDPLSALKDVIIGFFTAIYNFLRSIPIVGNLLPALSGSSGSGGTTSTTPSANSGGSNTFNFFGITSDQLPDQIRNILRQDGSRYQS